MTLAFAAFAVVMAAVLLVNHPSDLPEPLPAQNQDAETALFLIAFAVILPLALLAGPRLADALAAGPNGAALPALAAALALTLAATVLAVKLSGSLPWGDGVGTVLAGFGAWSIAASAALARAALPRRWPALLRLAPAAALVSGAAVLLVLGTLLCLTHFDSVSPVALVLGAVAAAGAIAFERQRGLPRLPRRWRVALDLTIAGLLLAAVPDLVIFRPEEAAGSTAVAFETGIIQFHQNFLLGPANQVLGGGALLIDTASQYGVGSIYLLAGWFKLAPIGYGTLGFLDGALTGLAFAASYFLLRVAGCSRLLAGSALALGVLVLAYNLVYPIGALPQQGPLRFGLPLAVIVAAAAGERWPRRAGATRVAALTVIGIAAIWSLEAFAFTLATFAAIGCFEAWQLPAPQRLRRLLLEAGLVACACLLAHIVFAAATVAATGELPDWGQYLAYLDAFLFGRLGDLTYDFSPWAPGLAVGALYVTSAAALVLLVRRHGDFVRSERTALLILAGTTAYGIALFSYFVNRSADHILPYASMPALLTGTLWLGLLLRQRRLVSAPVRTGGLAFALSVALLLAAVAWSSLGDRLPQSALAHALPRGNGLRAALDRLWHPPPLDPRAPQGELLLDRYMPGDRHVVITLRPDLETEILIRSGRANQLPLGDPWEDSFVSSERLSGLGEAIAGLRGGERMLLDRGALGVLETLRAYPSIDPLTQPGAPGALAPLQRWALKRIDERFRIEPIHRDEQGFVVARLAERR